MSIPLSIRIAGEADFSRILALLRESKLPVDGIAPGMRHVFVAEIRGRIVGCAALEAEGSVGLLRSVVVESSARGHGVGSLLVEAVHARGAELGLEVIYLLTTTAEGYFPKFGYVRSDRTEIPSVVTGSPEYSTCSEIGATLMIKKMLRC